MTIQLLLVDDEKDFVEAMAKFLRIRQIDVKVAYNGVDALELVNRNEFDVIVLDILMPGKNGIVTFREIRAIKPDVYIIILSGHAQVDAAIESVRLDAFDYLLKPLAPGDLYDKVQTAYQHKQLQQRRSLSQP